jgi:hypothetical protein
MKNTLVGRQLPQANVDGDETFHLDGLDDRDCGICARPWSVAFTGSCTARELKLNRALFGEIENRTLAQDCFRRLGRSALLVKEQTRA